MSELCGDPRSESGGCRELQINETREYLLVFSYPFIKNSLIEFYSNYNKEAKTVKPKLLDQVSCVRARHLGYRTEQAYVNWIRSFILFYDKQHPAEMDETEVSLFGIVMIRCVQRMVKMYIYPKFMLDISQVFKVDVIFTGRNCITD